MHNGSVVGSTDDSLSDCKGSNTVQRKTFEGENFHEFHGFVAIRVSFLREIWGVASFGVAKANNRESFPLYSIQVFPF